MSAARYTRTPRFSTRRETPAGRGASAEDQKYVQALDSLVATSGLEENTIWAGYQYDPGLTVARSILQTHDSL